MNKVYFCLIVGTILVVTTAQNNQEIPDPFQACRDIENVMSQQNERTNQFINCVMIYDERNGCDRRIKHFSCEF